MLTAARTDATPGAAGRAMRGAALLSLAAHALALALPVAWWLVPASGPREVEAQIAVLFGNNADASGAPADAAAPPVAATAARADVLPDQSGAAPPPAAEAPHSSGGKIGLLVAHPDLNMTEAQADPGNRAPKYPDSARLAREQGEVVLRLHIDPNGRVSRAELRQSSGHAALDRAAALALARWRFIPALRDGVAVDSYRDQATDFELEGIR